MTQRQKSWPAQHFVSALKSGGGFATIILLELCKNSFKRKARRKSSIFSFKVSKLEDVSHKMFFLALQTPKLAGHSCVLRGRRNAFEACQ